MVNYFCILKSCGNLGEAEKGNMIHARLHKEELFDNLEILLQNELFICLSNVVHFLEQERCLKKLSLETLHSFLAMPKSNLLKKHSVSCLKQMQHEGQWPNEVTIICILKACSSTRALDKGIEIHEFINRGFKDEGTKYSSLQCIHGGYVQ